LGAQKGAHPEVSSLKHHDLNAIVRAYKDKNRPTLARLLGSYHDLPSLNEAIRKAAHGLDEKGKRHRHQSRIKREAIRAAHRALAAVETTLASITDFDSLHSVVEARTHSIDGIGELYIYDVALRIGAFLRIEPTKVYLHAGTRRGALRLGFPPSMKTIRPEELPSELAELRPFEIEDLLCIYEDRS